MNKLFIWDDMLRIMDTHGCRPYVRIIPVNADLLLRLKENLESMLNISSTISHNVEENTF